MFRKLLMYDWKSVRGILGLLCLICLGAGVLGGFGLRLLIFAVDDPEFSAFQTVLSMSAVMACYLAIVICAAGSLFYCIWRFYRSRYADEGYMTFTLPATTHQILLSGLTATLLAMLCATVAVAVSIGTAVCIGMTAVDGFYADAARDLPLLWEKIRKAIGHEMGAFVSMLFYIPVAAVAQVIIMMLSVTVGSVAARKLKVLAAIGIYYGINVAVSVATSLIMVLGGLTSVSSNELLNRFFLYPTILMAALGIGGYFLMHHLTNKKLNLP